jgi:SAM-dependent methyltransferase
LIHRGARAFALTAEAYERARPSYPSEALDWLVATARLEARDTVVDLAAGTGKLTRLLVARGFRVIAVEPVDEMRRLLERHVPGVDARAGTAEEIPVQDSTARAVTVAQAYHWFDEARALPELARVIEQGGALTMIVNVRDLRDPLQAALRDLMAPYRERYPNPAWDENLRENEFFAAPRTATFPNDQLVDRENVVERVASVSWIGALPDETREQVLEGARRLVADRDEPIRLPYVTQVFVCRRR